MLKKIATLMRGASTSEDLRSALAAIDDAPHEAALASARQRRAELLLTGDDAEVLAAEAAADAARIALDRNAAARDALAAKIADAEAREAHDAFWTTYKGAVAKRDAVIKRIHGEFARAAKVIASVLEEGAQADREISALQEDDLLKYETVKPKSVGALVWGDYYSPSVHLGHVALPATKNSPSVGRFTETRLQVEPRFGA